jgi:DNA adenine methylase
MKPLFCRIGSKKKQVKQLLSLFPPHEVYVEPFFGGGAVFFGKPPSSKEVVNDLDSDLIADYKRVLSAPNSPSSYPAPKTLASQKRFLSSHQSSIGAKVVESIIRRCNGFSGRAVNKSNIVYRASDPSSKTDRIAEYKERLGHATLLNEDYRKVIKKYDSPQTFFFLDPPYEDSDNLEYAKGSDAFDFEELAELLNGIKGKFFVTINDSPRIRKAFAEANIRGYTVKGNNNRYKTIGTKDRKELFITNYDLKTGGRTHRENVLKTLGMKSGNVESLAEATGISEDILQQVYNRGIGAYKTNPESVRMKGTFEKGPAPMSMKLSPEQWAMARVYSFIDGNPKHDNDLRGGKHTDLPVPRNYLRDIKAKAKEEGYDPDAVSLATDGIHKLAYKTPGGKVVLFGRVGYGDYLIWSFLEKHGKVSSGYADTKRHTFHASHEAMKGNWKTNTYSPNNLALALLW